MDVWKVLAIEMQLGASFDRRDNATSQYHGPNRGDDIQQLIDWSLRRRHSKCQDEMKAKWEEGRKVERVEVEKRRFQIREIE